MSVERTLLNLSRGVQIAKLVAWTIFALAGPVTSLLMRNYLGVTVTGGISLVLGLALPIPDSKPRSLQVLRLVLATQGLLLGAYGGYVLSRPPDPWVFEAGGTRASLALAEDGRVYALEFSEVEAGFFVRSAGGEWQRSAFPGRMALEVVVVPRNGVVFAREDRADVLWSLGADGAWQRASGFRHPAKMAANDIALFVAARGALHRIVGPTSRPHEMPDVGAASVVCARGRRVLALQPLSELGAGKAWQSEDGGATFTEMAGVSLPASRCGLARDGTMWIAAEGFFTGALSVGAPGAGFASRSAPAPRIEAIAVNPNDGREAWIGVWGAGVFRSVDGGQSWTEMGLKGSEVSALVVDFERRRAYASTGSGVHSLAF